GTANARSTLQDRGLSGLKQVRDESVLGKWARKRDWARVLGGELDFDPQDWAPESPRLTPAQRGLAPVVPPSDRPTQRRTPAGHGRSSVEAIHSDPKLTTQITSGQGYVFVGSKGQNFAHPETVRALKVVGQRWAELHPGGPRIRAGAVGVVYGG